MATISIPIDKKTEDAINAIRAAGREPEVFVNYYAGKGRVLEIFDDEQSETKTESCIVCGVYDKPVNLVQYSPSFGWKAHPKCRGLDEKRGAFK